MNDETNSKDQEGKFEIIKLHLESLPEIVLATLHEIRSGFNARTEYMVCFLAPKQPEFNLAKLNEFLYSLIPKNLEPDSISEFGYKTKGSLYFGTITFREIVGQIIITHNIEKRIVTQDRHVLEAEVFKGGSLSSHTEKEDYFRVTKLRLYPSERYAKNAFSKTADYAKVSLDVLMRDYSPHER